MSAGQVAAATAGQAGRLGESVVRRPEDLLPVGERGVKDPVAADPLEAPSRKSTLAGSSIKGSVPAAVPSLRQISMECPARWVKK